MDEIENVDKFDECRGENVGNSADGYLDDAFHRRTFLKATGGGIALTAAPGYASAADSTDKGIPKEAWYGIPRPPGLSGPHKPIVVVGDDYGPVPATVPSGEHNYNELEGDAIHAHLEEIVGFSRESYNRGNRVWGRIAGRVSLDDTIEWASNEFQKAGLSNVEVQNFGQFESKGPIRRPTNWEVKLLGGSTFGPESEDVVLESAIPGFGSTLPSGNLTAPVVYTGNVTGIDVGDLDVDGKIAVQHITTKDGVFLRSGIVTKRAQELAAQGAVAVLNVIAQPGNTHEKWFDKRQGTKNFASFNLGGRDGSFLEAVINSAAEAGASHDLEIQIKLEIEERNDLTAANAVGVIPGKADKNIIVNAHANGWFDGAGDNGDGLAVLIALARHFTKLDSQLNPNLVFVASAGHHTPALNGPAHFVKMNPSVVERNTMIVNVEHIAWFGMNPSLQRPPEGQGYRSLITNTTEQAKIFGISNESSRLEKIARKGVDRYGVNIYSTATSAVPGDLGEYEPVGTPMVQMIGGGPMYHSSGDVIETISTPGLERAARFYAYLLKEAASSKIKYYQVDFVAGKPIKNLRGSNGTYSNNQLIRYLHGSTNEPIMRRSEGEFTTDDALAERIDSQSIEVESGTATVKFTVTNGESITLSLASYEKVAAGWSPESEAKQEFVDADTQTFDPGMHTLSVGLPNEDTNTTN